MAPRAFISGICNTAFLNCDGRADRLSASPLAPELIVPSGAWFVLLFNYREIQTPSQTAQSDVHAANDDIYR